MLRNREESKIVKYVETEWKCKVASIKKVDSDPNCPVWRLEVLNLPDTKSVLACPVPALNAYDPALLFRLDGKHYDSIEAEAIDKTKSFHIGLMVRMGFLPTLVDEIQTTAAAGGVN